MTDVETGISDSDRCYGVVTFENSEKCNLAVSTKNGQILRDTAIAVCHRGSLQAVRQRRAEKAACILFVGNIPRKMAREVLKSELAGIVQVPIRECRYKQGYCFLSFYNADDAKAAKVRLTDRIVGEQRLNVEYKHEGVPGNHPRHLAPFVS